MSAYDEAIEAMARIGFDKLATPGRPHRSFDEISNQDMWRQESKAFLDAFLSNPSQVVAVLQERGLIEHAGAWDAPKVTDEQIEAACEEVNRHMLANDDDYDDEAASDAAWRYDQLIGVRDHVGVYYEDEGRPDGAIPLYRFTLEASDDD